MLAFQSDLSTPIRVSLIVVPDNWVPYMGPARDKKKWRQFCCRQVGRVVLARVAIPPSLCWIFYCLRPGRKLDLNLFLLGPPAKTDAAMYKVDFQGLRTPLFLTLLMPLAITWLLSILLRFKPILIYYYLYEMSGNIVDFVSHNSIDLF